MRALQYRKSVPRYLLLKTLGSRWRGLYTSSASPVSLREVAPPRLPGARWVRVQPSLSGICGSDLATLTAKGSPYFSTLTSMPFVLGHEVVGKVTEVGTAVRGIREHDRVVLHPALGCRVRGIDPPCDACSGGADALCRRVTDGDISAGIQTGYCRDTGGGWSDGFVAHESQLYRVSDEIPDKVAVLIEPLACALHGALRVRSGENDTVLVLGCGAIGLLTITALRAVGCASRILAVAKYDHQRELAASFGVDAFLPAGGTLKQRYAAWSNELDARFLAAELGKPTVIGGADVVFDCVGSPGSIDDAIRFTRAGGTMVLVGMPGIGSGIDWTPLWYQELTVKAAYAYGPECGSSDKDAADAGQRDTFDIALDLLPAWASRLEKLVGEPYPLEAYRDAFRSALQTGRSKVAKTLFVVNEE